MVNYTEELFNAIKTISKKEVEALHFDTTVEVTVTDASKAHLGIYTVTNGSIYFTAYSTNTYKEKDRVLVMIPQGDYDQQKIIIGKKSHGDVDKPINYTEPFSQIIDVTNNLIPEGIAEFGMIANGAERKWENSDTSKLIDISGVLNEPCLIWSARPYPIEEEDGFKEEKGLTRIGLKADFKTLLKQCNTISGNYGLVLCVGFRNPDEQLSENSLHSTIIQPFVFDSKDFFGNIYNFNAYYAQEAVFDISQYSDLILSDIFLFGYQKSNFKDINGKLIPSENVSENIFINNYYICLGNDISEFKGDSLELYSFNETLFNKTNDNNSNSKDIYLRWIHQYETSNVVKALANNEIAELENYEVRWYKYKLGAPSPDSFMGAHWELIPLSEDANKTTYQLDVDTTKEFERIQVAVIKNGVQLIARSNILEFTNEKEIVNNSLVKDINALSIRYDDDRHGNYFVYDSMQNVLNNEDTIIRQLTAVFADNIENVYDKSVLSDCESIKWIFPDSNSMIVPLDFNQDIIHFKNEDQKKTQVDDFWVQHINGNYIVSKDDLGGAADISKYISIYYKINKNLNFNFGRNTVYLEVIKNGQTYITSVTMQFNIAGTSGSEYTLVINWDNQKNTFDIKQDEELSGDVLLLDPQGYEVELNSGANYEYNWHKINGTEHLTISHSNDNNSHFSISKTGELDINELYVLEVKLTGFGNYELVTRAPIPLTQLYANVNDQIFKVGQIEGPTTVRYSADGILAFDKTPYNILLQKKNQNQWENIEDASDVGYWKIIPEDTSMAYLTQNSSSTINNIIDFFTENNDNTNDYLRLLYRLIKETTDLNAEQEFQHLKNLQELDITTVVNALNSNNNDQIRSENVLFFQDDQGYQKLQDIINKYKKCLNNNSNNSFLLLKLLQKIDFNSQPYEKGDISTLSGILKLKNWENFLKDTQLLPVTFYASNADLYGVQYVYNEEITINGQTFKNITLWTQPIYVYKNNYPSPTLNQWDGKLVIDKDNNMILAQGMSAGTKEKDNTFSGVMFGDWTKDNTATPLTGVYGFYHGQITYALKEDGSAFFGNDNGKISFNDNNSINLLVEENNNRVEIKPGAIIVQTREKATDQYQSLLEINKTNNKNIYLLQSQNFSDNQQTGMKIDLQNGQIKGYNFSLSSQSVVGNINYGMFLSSGQQNLPLLKISRETIEKNLNYDYENDLYSNEIEKKIEELQVFILKYFTYYLNLITLFEWFYKYDNTLFRIEKTEQEQNNQPNLLTDKEFYQYLLEYFNSEEDTVDQLCEKILLQAQETNNTYLYDEETNVLKENWYFYWNFDEIPNAFLQLLTQDQVDQLKNKLNIYSLNNNINISSSKNLFYPKIPKNKLNNEDEDYSNFMYNKIYQNYNTSIYHIETLGDLSDSSSLTYQEKRDYVNQTNAKAKEIIESCQLEKNDYTYKYVTITDPNSGEHTSVGYIKIFTGVLTTLNVLQRHMDSTGYYLQAQSNSSQSNSYVGTNKKLLFTQETIPINNNQRIIYKLSALISPLDPFVLVERTGTSSGDQASVVYSATGDKTIFKKTIIKYNQTPVEIFLIPGDPDNAWSATDREIFQQQEQLVYMSPSQIKLSNSHRIYIGLKIKPATSLIGGQKVRTIIQEKINNYNQILSDCYDLTYVQDTNSTFKLLNDYYITYQTTLRGLIGKYSNSNLIRSQNYVPLIQIPMDFSFRESFVVPEEEQDNFYLWDGEDFKKCSNQDFEQSNNNYILKNSNNQDYYIRLHSSVNLKNYFQLYNKITIPSSSSKYHNESDGRQSYSPIKQCIISNLAMSILKTAEELYYEEQMSKTIEDSNQTNQNYIFDTKTWANDLINIDKNGGYLTSRHYRPTILSTDTSIRKPTDYQNPGTTVGWSYGMRGMIIDLTNDRIVLGNNAEIQGFQTQYYPGQTDINHRSFIISTGAKFSGKTVEDREILGTDGKFFIIARDGPTSSSSEGVYQRVFTVNWDGIVACRGITGLDNGTLKVQNNLSVNNSFILNNHQLKFYDYYVQNITGSDGKTYANVLSISDSYTNGKGIVIALA